MDWLVPTRRHSQTEVPDKEKSKSAGSARLLRTAERPGTSIAVSSML
jgi:hypothetical protein